MGPHTGDGPVLGLDLVWGRDFSLTFLMQLEPCVTVFLSLLGGGIVVGLNAKHRVMIL